jgi:hypothetical protein
MDLASSELEGGVVSASSGSSITIVEADFVRSKLAAAGTTSMPGSAAAGPSARAEAINFFISCHPDERILD